MNKIITGHIQKMRSALAGTLEYHFVLTPNEIPLNALIGQNLQLTFTGEIACIQCQRVIKKSFQQGYCYPCLQRLQECNLCMIYPERCKVEEGGCSQDDWAHQHCHQEHVVYLANSTGLKVGITRVSHIPTRWIDQGAKQGLPIFKTKNRYQAGRIEVFFKKYINDRTQWQKMLKAEATTMNLMAERDRLFDDKAISEALQLFRDSGSTVVENAAVTEINYPVLKYPEKITTFSFDKNPLVTGKLHGIKGQYLLLDNGVINIRKFGGYKIEFQVR